MKQLLKILILEDLSSDAELVQIQLEELDFDLQFKVTDKKSEFEDLLSTFDPELVISDFSLPAYNGLEALEFLRKRDAHTPFIFVTGTLGEEKAVRAIKSGASDFLIKENLSQLPVAVMRALRERDEVRKKKAYESQLIAINALNSALLQFDQWEKALNEAFAIIGDALKVDRVYYFENHLNEAGQEVTSQRFEWSGNSAEPQIDNPEMQNLPHETIAELIEPLKKNIPFQAIVSRLPETSFREILVDQDVRSILVLPVFVKNRFYAFIGFDDCRNEREWSEDEHSFLASLTSSLSNVIEKRDILEDLKRSRMNYKKAHDRLKKAQEIAKIGYWVWEMDSELSEWSEETYSIYGYTPENFTPTLENLKLTLHPEDRYLMERDPKEIMVSGNGNSFEHRIITASGETRWVRMHINYILDEQGKPSVMEGTVQDITDQKDREEQIRISNERFELAMKATTELIWDWDHRTGEVLRSFNYESRFVYNPREGSGPDNSWFSRVHPEDIEDVWYYLNSCLADKSLHHWEKEYRIIRRDDQVAFVVDRGFIIRNEEGKPVRSVGATLDVTESREQFEKIKEQNEALREIAWLQSHVIRAPLSRIMGLTLLAEEEDGGGKSMKEIFELIKTSAQELDEVIMEITHKTESVKGL